MIAALVIACLIPLAVGAYLFIEARRLRRESLDELRKERESMRVEREAYRVERTELVNRVMWALGRPYEAPPVWERDVPEPEVEDEGVVLEGDWNLALVREAISEP